MKLEPLKKRAEEYATKILHDRMVQPGDEYYVVAHLRIATAYYDGFIECKEDGVAVVNGQMKTITKSEDSAKFVVNRIWHGLVKLGEK